jgi:hypothetical protein
MGLRSRIAPETLIGWSWLLGGILVALSPWLFFQMTDDRPWIELLGPMQHTGQRAASLCTGRRLQAWLNEVKQRSAGRMANLGATETAGAQAGELLLEFTLLSSERNQEEARAVQGQLRSALPERVFQTISPKEPFGTAR